MDDLFDAMPGIQIREFLPDTRLDQAFNMFSSIILDTLKDLLLKDEGGKDASLLDMTKALFSGKIGERLASDGMWDRIKLSMNYIIDWITMG